VHPIEQVRRICADNGLTLSDAQVEALRAYGELLGAWNRKVNLISRRDEHALWFSHILHSLAPWFYVRLPPDVGVLDLGSGGGLPGIPLAILRNDLRVVLLDSIKKKTLALEQIVQELGLANASVRTARAEDPSFRKSFRCDVVIARAVAPLDTLIRWSRHLLVGGGSGTPGLVAPGTLLAMKGGELEGEIQRARVKAGAFGLEVIDLSFRESHQFALEGKKLLVVTPS
jgi:16S rRNA (guanine527-N7)-methyltransferase